MLQFRMYRLLGRGSWRCRSAVARVGCMPRPVPSSSRAFVNYHPIGGEPDDCFTREEEDMEFGLDFTQGGLHPIELDDVVGSKYRVIHKLAVSDTWSSSVWIAQDVAEQRLVALKVWRADRSLGAHQERKIINHLNQSCPAQVTTGAIPRILDEFMIHGQYIFSMAGS